jgi:hypothetical protein
MKMVQKQQQDYCTEQKCWPTLAGFPCTVKGLRL